MTATGTVFILKLGAERLVLFFWFSRVRPWVAYGKIAPLFYSPLQLGDLNAFFPRPTLD